MNSIESIKDLLDESERKIRADLKKMYRLFPQHFHMLKSELKTYNKKFYQTDKEFLYQEVIDLEKRRSSLIEIQNNIKDGQEEGVKDKLLYISLKVIYLRFLITFLGRSSHSVEALLKKIIEI